MKTKLIALVFGVALLAGCGSTSYGDYNKLQTVVGPAYLFTIHTDDDRVIPCVYVRQGLSCDWSKK